MAKKPEASTDPAAREAPGQPRRSDPWKVAFVTLLIVGVLAVVVWLLLGSRLLVVRDVAVSGAERLDTGEVVAAVEVATGTPLARVDTSAAAARVEELRLVESAEVSRGWPATLRVEIVERTPALSVRAEDGYQLVDHDGVRIEDSDEQPENHPLVLVRGQVEGNPAVAEAAVIAREIPDNVLEQLDEIDTASGEAITLRLSGGASVVWGDGARSARKAAVLDVLMREHPPGEGVHYDVSTPDVAVVR